MAKERSIRVLLIDDDEDEFIVIRELLAEAKDYRFHLEWTSDPQEAKEKILSRSHDIYLLDYRLGGVSGVDLLQEAIKEGAKAPIILLTGYNDENLDLKAMKMGAADYLLKDRLSSYLLERAIRYAIYRTQMRSQAISQDRMASIGLVASSLAHEIGTPLGVIRGRAEVLAAQTAGNPDLQKHADAIMSQIDRVSGLIRSLLNLARGDKSDKIEAVSVNVCLKEVLNLLEHEIRRNEIHIDNELHDDKPIWIQGQPEKLHQLLLNLIVNAIYAIRKAKESGRADGHFIKFSYEDRGSQYLISVQDSGCGIPADLVQNLFRPFFSTKPTGEGTGLGLSTSKWIMDSWGGSIKAESREGIGTTFRLYIPKAT